jgi:hypothetical protein
MPTAVISPLFGELKLGPRESPTTFLVVVEESAGKPLLLFMDANGYGDLTDDLPAQWKPKPNKLEGKEYNTGMNIKSRHLL